MKDVCIKCGNSRPRAFEPFCACGGMMDVVYDLDVVRLVDSSNPYERFGALLPVEDPALLPQDAEYTPTIHATRLGAELGMPRLYLKNETVLPTKSTKDRMAAVALAYLHECGVRRFCTSSTGNSSSAYARAIQHFDGMQMCVFTASEFRERVHHTRHDQIRHIVLRDATFVEAFNVARDFAAKHDYVAERGFFNPGRREGLKIAFLEAVEQVPEPIDWYVQAVSSAMGVFGTYKGGKELVQLGRLPRAPRLLCVQQDTCAPMVRAWEDGAEAIGPEHVVAEPTGLAKAILRGDPSRTYPYVREIVDESDGAFAAVSADEIREAQRLVESLEGVRCCAASSAAVAGLIRLVRAGRFPREETVLVNLTGADRPADPAPGEAEWWRRAGEGWVAERPEPASI